MVKKIAVEEHANKTDQEILDKRLQDMDEAGIEMQIMSFGLFMNEEISTAESISRVKTANDTLAQIVEKNPKRFAGYASLPLKDPEAAAAELQRSAKDLRLRGALIFVGWEGTYMDEPKYQVIFEMAEKLDMPIYLHPGRLLPDMRQPYMAYPLLASSMWGFSVGTSLHAMRLICSGIFDRYPRLKIILGHLGEGIPYFLWRMDNRWLKEKDVQGIGKSDPITSRLKKLPSQYIKENIYVTTSGMFWAPVLQFVNSVLGADRILFAADYPQESALEAAQFIESAPLSDSDKEKICHLNAENLFKL